MFSCLQLKQVALRCVQFPWGHSCWLSRWLCICLSAQVLNTHTHHHTYKHNQSMQRQLVCRRTPLFQVTPFILVEMTLHEGPVNLACCEVACYMCLYKGGAKVIKNISARASWEETWFYWGQSLQKMRNSSQNRSWGLQRSIFLS